MNYKNITRCAHCIVLYVCIISNTIYPAFFNPVPLNSNNLATQVASTLLDQVKETAGPTAQSILQNRYYQAVCTMAFYGAIAFFGYWICRYINDNRNTHDTCFMSYKNNKLELRTDGPVIIEEHDGPFQPETRDLLEPQPIYRNANNSGLLATCLSWLKAAPQKARNASMSNLLSSSWRWLRQPPHNHVSMTYIRVPLATTIDVHTFNEQPYTYTGPALVLRNTHGQAKISARCGDITIAGNHGLVIAETIGEIAVERHIGPVLARNFSVLRGSRAEGSMAELKVLDSSRAEPLLADGQYQAVYNY